MDRVRTGVRGFDELVEGGLPKQTNTIITGPPGAGKTIFALQYLIEGTMNNENGIYLTFDTVPEKLKVQAKQFGWDLEELEKQGKIEIINVSLNENRFDLFDLIKFSAFKIKAKRLVFDNIATFAINLDLFSIPTGYAKKVASIMEVSGKAVGGNRVHYTADTKKRIIYLIAQELSKLETTNLLITYAGRREDSITTDGISEFVADGVVRLYSQQIGAKFIRTMAVLKMRTTKHSTYIHDFIIDESGVKVSSAEEVYK